MRINIFSYVFWPESFLINELAFELAQKNIDISVQTSLPNYQNGHLDSKYNFLSGPYFEKVQGVDVYRYPAIPRNKGFLNLALNYFSNILFGFLNLIRMPKADLYFVFATSPLIAFLPIVFLKKITRKPLVIWYQDLWPESFFAVLKKKPSGFMAVFLEVIVKFIYRNTDLMLIQNESFRDNLNRLGYRGEIQTMYNWAPDSKIDEIKLPDWLNQLPINKKIITFAGNIGRVQGLTEVIATARYLEKSNPDLHFVIVGDGSFFDEIKNISQGLSNVTFTGRKPVHEMPYLFQKSDALLVSLNDDPTFNLVIPSKLQAYFAAAKPVIGFLNGAGAKIIVQSQAGLIANAQNVEHFIQVMKEFDSLTPEAKRKLGLNAQDFYTKHFQKDLIIEQFLVKINDLLSVKKRH